MRTTATPLPHLTRYEIAVLHALVLNETTQLNGQAPDTVGEACVMCGAWNDCIEDGPALAGYPMPKRDGLGGVLASLSKKGLVYTGDESSAPSVLGAMAWFTIISPISQKN